MKAKGNKTKKGIGGMKQVQFVSLKNYKDPLSIEGHKQKVESCLGELREAKAMLGHKMMLQGSPDDDGHCRDWIDRYRYDVEGKEIKLRIAQENYNFALKRFVDDKIELVRFALDKPPAAAGAKLTIGNIRDRLSLVSKPENKKPGVFKLGSKEYLVPSGKAWDWVENVILNNGFEGHPVQTKSPSPYFKREARAFFKELIRSPEKTQYFIRTQ